MRHGTETADTIQADPPSPGRLALYSTSCSTRRPTLLDRRLRISQELLQEVGSTQEARGALMRERHAYLKVPDPTVDEVKLSSRDMDEIPRPYGRPATARRSRPSRCIVGRSGRLGIPSIVRVRPRIAVLVRGSLGTAILVHVAERRELYYRLPEPEDSGHGLDPNDAQAITIPLHRFYSISDRKRIDKHLYWSVEYEASRIGIVVGFGRYGITVATDCSTSIRWEQSL